MFVTHVECTVCGHRHRADGLLTVCAKCGQMLAVRYDLARVGRFRFHGFIAWLAWLGVHLIWLIGFRNRLLVLINWAADYLFYERAVRLILPDGDPKTDDTPWPLRVFSFPVPEERERV